MRRTRHHYVLLIPWRRAPPWQRTFHRCQSAACRKLRFLRQRSAVNQRPQSVQCLRVLLEQLFARFEERQLQEALGAVTLDARPVRLIHVLARVLSVEEQGIEQRGDQSFISDEHGLVGVCGDQ